MSGDMHRANTPSSDGPDAGAALPGHDRADAIAIRLLVGLEHVLLYVVAFGLLVVGAAVLASSAASAILQHASWTARLITSVEGILLYLIIMEIFITILTHARGGRIQLEFFIVIGVIALVRHILSVVVRLTIPTSPPASRQQLWDLAVDAGAAFVLVVALAIARWSARRTDAA
ncbi:phosphate-starvation-inducible PsiE family protein [Actinoallomurus liliacearum]